MKLTDRIEIDGISREAQEWARLHNIPWRTAQRRHSHNGRPLAECVTRPVATKSQAGRKGRMLSSWNGQPFLRGSRGRNPA